MNINETIDELNKNMAFQMSLSGKELFHSNMIAMFLTQVKEDKVTPTELAKKIMKFFPPKDNDNKTVGEDLVVFDVLREKQHMDLIICYCSKEDKDTLVNKYNKYCIDDISFSINDSKEKYKEMKEANNDSDVEALLDDDEIEKLKGIAEILHKMKYVIIENKFKSFPYPKQLDEYTSKDFSVFPNLKFKGEKNQNYKIQNPTCYLFAPKSSLVSFFKTNSNKENEYKAWEGKSYDEFKDILKEYVNCAEKDSDTLMTQFIKSYSDFLEKMLGLFTNLVENRLDSGKCFLSSENNKILMKGRVQDFYEKILFNKLLSKLKEKDCFENNSEQKDLKNYDDKDWPFFYSNVDYTNQMGLLDFRYVWGDILVTAGVQIQGSRFELVISAERSAYQRVFGCKKFTEDLNSFLEKDKKMEEYKAFKDDEEKSKKWVEKIFSQIKDCDEIKKVGISLPDKPSFKRDGSVPKFEKENYYVYRYGFINLNYVASKGVKEKGEAYREIDFDTLFILLKNSLEVIKKNKDLYKSL